MSMVHLEIDMKIEDAAIIENEMHIRTRYFLAN